MSLKPDWILCLVILIITCNIINIFELIIYEFFMNRKEFNKTLENELSHNIPFFIFILPFLIILSPLICWFVINETELKNIRSLPWKHILKYIILFAPILALSLLWFV